MTHWQWAHPVNVFFKTGGFEPFLKTITYKRIALITSPGFQKRGLVNRILELIDDKVVAVIDNVEPNPTIDQTIEMAFKLREAAPDCLLAVGGGSTMDSAKGVARILGESTNWCFKKHLTGQCPSTSKVKLKIVAVPTTSGTGSEVTSFGTMWNHAETQKFSVVGQDLYPQIAFLDPELTNTLPEEITITSALDALSHALESVWNKNANEITLAYSRKSLELSLNYLTALLADPSDLFLRAKLMEASLLAGYAISQTRTALAHSISYPLTSMFGLPHGFACSFSLPAILDYNSKVDDGRLSSLAESLGHKSMEGFRDEIVSIFQKVNLKKYLEMYISDFSLVKNNISLMINPDRADHNLRAVMSGDISGLLDEAFYYMN
jgi:alcohol dehydrogenase